MSKVKKAPKPEEVQATIKKLTQQVLKEALEAELEEFLGYSKYQRSDSDNYRNGHSPKTVKTSSGLIEIQVLRDRNGQFEPKLIRKRQTMLDEIENQIVALYAKGMTPRDIQELLSEMYGFEVSPSHPRDFFRLNKDTCIFNADLSDLEGGLYLWSLWKTFCQTFRSRPFYALVRLIIIP